MANVKTFTTISDFYRRRVLTTVNCANVSDVFFFLIT